MPRNNLFRRLYVTSIITFLMFLFCIHISISVAADKDQNRFNKIKKLLPDSTYVTNKVVYVDFWASWCVPCRKSFPWMKEMLEKYSDSGLVIITINVDKDSSAANTFLNEHGFNSLNIFDPSGEIAKSFELEVMPTSFMYNKSEELVLRHEGFSKDETKSIENNIVTLLNGDLIKHE